MLVFVFSCTMMSTVAGKSTLPLTWSPCVWVLISVVTGLLVSSLILSRTGWPQPGFFASTTTTPVPVMNTAVFPPPPLSTNRLSLSFSTSTILGACCPAPPACRAATTIDSAPTPISTPRATLLFILNLHYQNARQAVYYGPVSRERNLGSQTPSPGRGRPTVA